MEQSQGFTDIHLPPLIESVEIAFDDYDLDGKPQWLLYDAARRQFFIIGWVENEILKHWSLGDVNKVIEAVNNHSTLRIDETEVAELLRFLKSNCLVKQSGYEIATYAKAQSSNQQESYYQWLVKHYLSFRIPLIYPDAFLTRTLPYVRFLFHRYTGYVMTILAMLGLYQLTTQWELFTHTFPTIISVKGLILYVLAFTFVKLCHELGHAYMCKRYNVPVPVLGIAFLVFWPVLYTDTSLSWSLNYKKRLNIALAGIIVETYLTIIALLLWCNIDSNLLKTICYLIITINWTASLLINISPFMRFDGYYILADLLRMPNLQPRAFALTRWQLRRILFDINEPPPEIFSGRMRIILITYSITTWLYRLIIYFAIALLVYHFFVKALGILLFIIEIYYFILQPILVELKYWVQAWPILISQKRTKVTGIILLALFIYICLPIQTTIKIPATLYYYHQFLYAKEEGILQTPLPAPGTPIKANQSIAIIYSPIIAYNLEKVYLEYKKKLNELRRSAIEADYSFYRPIILSNMSMQYAAYQKLLQIYNQLNLSVPFDGVISEIDTELRPGTYIKKNEWLADVINPKVMQVEAFVPQTEINRIHVGMQGDFYPGDATVTRVPVTIKTVEILNAKELVCGSSVNLNQPSKESRMIETPCYQASDLGGKIPVYPTPDGNYAPVESVYRVVLAVKSSKNIKHVVRGTVILTGKRASYFSRFYHQIKDTLIQQAGF